MRRHLRSTWVREDRDAAMDTVAVIEEPDAMSAYSADALHQMILNVEQNSHDDHDRLRKELVALKIELDRGLQSVRADNVAHEVRFATMAATPVDATKLVLSTKVIVGLVIASLTIGGSIWNLGTRIDAQRVANDNYREIQKLESSALKTAIDDMKRRQELLGLQYNELNDKLTRLAPPQRR